jgi:glycosyltransferase 2 family protein
LLAIATRKRFWLAAAFGLFVLYYTFRHADFHKFTTHLGEINPLWGSAVAATAFLSYACIAGVLSNLLKGIGLPLSFKSVFKISLLSATLNYLMSVAGLSGVAAKVYLLSREKIPPSKTLSVSIIHGFLTNTIAVVFIYLGFFYLYSGRRMTEQSKIAGAFILLIAFVLTWLTVQTIVHEGFRKKIWGISIRVATAAAGKLKRPNWVPGERAETFFQNFNDSFNLVIQRPGVLARPASLALLDWVLMFLCLKFSFDAFGYPVSNQALLVGFSIGLFTGMLVLTPASIGLMEGSMVSSFYLMGLDYDYALAGVMLYRVAYYFLPMVVSIFFYKEFFPSAPARAKVSREARRRATDPSA